MAGLLCGVALVLWSLDDIRLHEREARRLGSKARRITSGLTDTRARALAISDAAWARLLPDDPPSGPLLRPTAWQSWRARRGTCGDGARIIVTMLHSLSIPAHRVYLGSHNGPYVHVAVVYYDRHRWRLVDTVNSEPGFREFIVAHPQPIHLLRRDNPYFDVYSYANWTRLFAVPIEQRLPWPQPVARLLESPHAIAAGVKALLAVLLMLLVL